MEQVFNKRGRGRLGKIWKEAFRHVMSYKDLTKDTTITKND